MEIREKVKWNRRKRIETVKNKIEFEPEINGLKKEAWFFWG